MENTPLRWHGQALLVRGIAGSILLTHGQTSLSVPPTVPPTHSSPVSGTNSSLRWHGQALLVRGAHGSILLDAVARTSSACPWYRRLYLFHSRTNKFVRATHRATNSLFASILNKLISPVARTSSPCPWRTRIYSARCGGTDKLCLSVVSPALSFSLTDKQVCPCHPLCHHRL